MSVVLGGSHDIRLASDATASPTTAIEFVLAQDEQGNKRWVEKRAAPLPPRTTQGPLQWTHKDPLVDYTQGQHGWRDGALQLRYDSNSINSYAQADGCDARWGSVTLGMKQDLADFIVRNGGAERGAITGWTAGSGVTLSASTSSPRTGSYVFSSVGGSSGAAQTLFSQAITNHAVWRSRAITVIAYIKRTAGSAGAFLRISDSAGNTDSSAITSSSYSYVSVTRTVDASASSLTIKIQSNANPSGNTFIVDDIQVIPTGGVVWKGTAELADNLYAACGRCVLKWDETNDVWDAVLVFTSATTDIITFGSNVFVAFGDGVAYYYGSSTTWVASTDTTSNDAIYFAVSRDRLWKNDGANSVRSTTTAINGGSPGAVWSSAYTVGGSDRAITNIYDLHDVLFIAKEDGIHYYQRNYDDGASADFFKNLTNEFSTNVHPDNFARGAEWHGRLFLSASLASFFMLDENFRINDLSGLFFHPELSSFGGRPWAMAADPAQLWLLVNTPTADTTPAKTIWLMSLRDPSSWKLHTMQTVTMGDINDLSVNRGYLYAMGRSYDSSLSDYVCSSWRWTLPSDNIAPAYASTPAIETSGTFDTPQLGFELPDTAKAQLAVTALVEDTDAEHTLVVTFGLDGAAPSTTTLGTFSGSGNLQTLYFNTITTPESNAIGRTTQLRFQLTTDDTVSPKLHAYALHSTVRPERTRIWECYVWLGPEVQLRNGNFDTVSKVTQLANLDTLEQQTYPIALEHDLDEDGDSTTIRVHILDAGRAPEDNAQTKEGVELWRLTLQEAGVS
jgi:hypothetical protein